jgi:NAD(P)-dependent dehydrogenase (short-subunit alcohol dehydrogenase family)
LASSESIDALVASLQHETIDLIIHNAGYNPKDSKKPGYFESTFYIANFSAAHVAESCLINALHPIELTGKLLPRLSDDATVMAISSWLGSMEKKNVPGHYGYSGSKALLNMMIRGLAMEFAKQSSSSSSSSSVQQQRSAIAVNPGWMQTDMGGTNADRTAPQVADDLFALVATPGLLRELNGKFVNPDGSQHPW